MKQEICEWCKEDISGKNARFIFKPLTIIGYQELEFCSKKCFINFVCKKFKLKINRK